ncbi:MAG: UDP-N-acetylmuramate dehydrogenase [Ruminococcaceae bacterium]|nr:UDP-N-acetylmuramate dehydrogenase [Oscillospiraceae bacterium]
MDSIKNEILIKKLSEMAEKDLLSYSQDADRAPYSTFKIGGKADFIVKVHTKESLAEILRFLYGNSVKYAVIGNGSNILFSDERYEGVIILTTSMTALTCEDNIIEAECGYSLTALASRAQKLSLTGLEFAYGIPGSVGGAVYMNAGAYDGEIKNVVTKTYYYDVKNDTFGEFTGEENKLGYRESVYQEKDGLVILGARFELEKGDSTAILEKMQGFMRARSEKQPLEYPSAGSTFKRAPGYFTAKLIDEAGLKGYSVGGAQVSEKHAGFVINRGGATSEDVKKLVSDIQKAVYKNSGVEIKCEIKIIE